jgi:hypothetical protein
MELTERHRSILREIGHAGAAAEKILRHGREFGELSAANLVVLWPHGQPRPPSVYGASDVPGRWYLTADGADAAGLDPPRLRLV